MPQKLADFIDSLVDHAKGRGVDIQQLCEIIRNRQLGIAISKVTSDFDSKPSYPNTLRKFATCDPFKLTEEAFDASSRQLRTTDVLKAMVEFINDPNGDDQFTKKAQKVTLNDPSRLDPDNNTRARKIYLMATLINNSINFNNSNDDGRTSFKVSTTSSPFAYFQDLAQKLVNMKSAVVHGLTPAELKGLGNSHEIGRGGFIQWLVKVVADAARGRNHEANSVGIENYNHLLNVINNIHLLSRN